ncbi:MAG: hypothetical protein AAGC57_02170 [Pseudomonadota bacterium]
MGILVTGQAVAVPVTLGFGSESGEFGLLDTYSEGGFTLLVESGLEWGFDDSAGNGPSSLVAGFDGEIGIGDTISITNDDDRLFQLLDVDLASLVDFDLSDGVDLIGLLDDVEVASITDITTDSDTFAALSSFGGVAIFTDFIDELQIVGASQNDASLLIDNLELQAVPVPTPILLLMSGLLGLGVIAYRRSAEA